MGQFEVSIALIFFIRPNTLEKVFERIKAIKPKKLFLIQDGPRLDHPDDIEKILECRKIVENIDWDCDILKNYSETNLGCGLRPSTGITWVFENTDKAIILEDDCVPDLSFFDFCKQMLEKYENDERIILISGMNLLESYETEYSYIFSKCCTIGAWATWKRVWDLYDFQIKKIDDKSLQKKLKNEIVFENAYRNKLNAWKMTRERIINNETITWWDYQLHFLLYTNSGLGIVPNKNTIENIGYGEGATHVSDKKATHFNIKSYTLDGCLIHPNNIICEWDFDEELYERQLGKLTMTRKILRLIKHTVKGIFRVK